MTEPTTDVAFVKTAEYYSGERKKNGFSPKHEENVGGCVKIMEEFSSVSIVGMSTVFSRGTHFVRRLLWIIVLVTSCVVTLVWVSDRVSYLLSTPISVNMQILEARELEFPAVTICDKNVWSMKRLKPLWAQLESNTSTDMRDILGLQYKDHPNGIGATELWDTVSHSISDIVKECTFGRNHPCTEQGRWNKVYTVMGLCYTLKIHEKTTLSGSFNNLFLKLQDYDELYDPTEDGWKVLIHHASDDPSLTIRTHGFTLPFGWGKDVQVQIQEFHTLDTWKRPCNGSSFYSKSDCISRCFSEKMLSVTGCNMPYMIATTAPGCNNKKSYKEGQTAFKKLFFYGEWNANDCECQRPCEIVLYELSVESTALSKSERNESSLRVYFQDMTFQDIRENYAYTTISMLCDVGGTLGLLLGASVLTLLQIIEVVLRACGKKEMK